MTVAAVFFDFDGTLVESLDAKVAAFRELYAPFGDAVADAAIAHYRATTGVPRGVRIRACHERLLGRVPDDREVRQLSDQFGRMVEGQVIAADFVPGAESFLWGHAGTPSLFIVSATPQPELDRIVTARAIEHYFEGVFGSPPDKAAILHDLLSTYWIDPARALMVGDGLADLEAATAAGIGFVGRVRPGDADPFPPSTHRIPDLTWLPPLLNDSGA